MLNAVALEFVLNVDELIFISLAPLSLKYLVENAKMLPKQAPPAWKGLELSTAINFVVVAGALGVFIQSVLLPQVDTLWRVVDAICGGEHGFVYSVDGAGLPVWAKTHRASPVLCRGPDTSRCSSLGSDCCAPVSKDEAATCRDGYVPLRVSGKCTGVSKGNVTGTFNEGRYTCCQQYVGQRPSRGWTPASKSELANMTFPQKVIDKVLGTTPADEELCLAKQGLCVVGLLLEHLCDPLLCNRQPRRLLLRVHWKFAQHAVEQQRHAKRVHSIDVLLWQRVFYHCHGTRVPLHVIQPFYVLGERVLKVAGV